MTQTLSTAALNTIEQYLSLPIAGKKVQCPYMNNKTSNVRAGLRVLLGKGSVQDILDEIELIALREKIDLNACSELEVKKLLIEHNIGIDCSGFAYYVLDAELRQTRKKSLRQLLSFPFSNSPIRKIITTLRPVENTNVRVFAHEKNSTSVSISDIAVGDMIIMIGTGKEHTLDHMLVIHAINTSKKQTVLSYSHALRWKTDGLYGHGVKQGTITITNPTLGLLDQQWEENKKQGEENETYWRATTATKLEIRRLI